MLFYDLPLDVKQLVLSYSLGDVKLLKNKNSNIVNAPPRCIDLSHHQSSPEQLQHGSTCKAGPRQKRSWTHEPRPRRHIRSARCQRHAVALAKHSRTSSKPHEHLGSLDCMDNCTALIFRFVV